MLEMLRGHWRLLVCGESVGREGKKTSTEQTGRERKDVGGPTSPKGERKGIKVKADASSYM